MCGDCIDLYVEVSDQLSDRAVEIVVIASPAGGRRHDTEFDQPVDVAANTLAADPCELREFRLVDSLLRIDLQQRIDDEMDAFVLTEGQSAGRIREPLLFHIRVGWRIVFSHSRSHDGCSFRTPDQTVRKQDANQREIG